MVHKRVERGISDDIEANPSWSMIYGRRKVGKTYLVDNFVSHDVFFTVRVDRSISARGIDVPIISDLDAFTPIVTGLLDQALGHNHGIEQRRGVLERHVGLLELKDHLLFVRFDRIHGF